MTWIRLPAPARCQSIRRVDHPPPRITFAVPLPGPFGFLTSPRRKLSANQFATHSEALPARSCAPYGLLPASRPPTEKHGVPLAAQRQVDSFRLVAILGSVAQEHFHHPDKSTQTKLLQSSGDSIGSGPRLPQIRVARSCRDYLTQFTGTRKSGFGISQS